MRTLILLLSAFTLVFIPVAYLQAEPKTNAKGKSEHKVPVVIALAKLQRLAPLTWVSGTVISRNDARLATEVEGRLKTVAEIGQRVKAGEVVASIDNVFVKLQVEELEAEVAKEQARLKFLKLELSRLNRLAVQNNAAQTRLEQTVADRSVAFSQLGIANTRLQRAKEELLRHEIRAPFSGVISQRLKTPGERAKIGEEVVRLVDPASLEIQARAPLSAVNFVEPGNELVIKKSTRDSSMQTATIRALVPIGNERSRMMDLRLQYAKNAWRVGQSVRVALPIAEAREVVAVPRDALVLRRDGTSVFRLKDDDTAEKIAVTLGVAAADLIEIIGNSLKPGDRVVTRGGERLRPGQKVNILTSVVSK